VVNVIVVGASGWGMSVLQYVRDTASKCPDITPRGFLDDYPISPETVLGSTINYEIQPDDRFIVSVGEPQLRHSIATRLARRGAKFFTLIHPLAYVDPTAKLGEGCIVCPFASVGSHAVLNEHVMLVMYSAVAHDVRVGAYSCLSPYAVASGGSVIGEKVFLGTHAIVTPNKEVGTGSKIASAAVVYRNVPEGTLAAGNPAKVYPLLRRNSE